MKPNFKEIDIKKVAATNVVGPNDANWLTPEQIPVKPIDWELAVGKGGQLMTPELPAKPTATGPEQAIELVPYGKTELRVTVFPVLAE